MNKTMRIQELPSASTIVFKGEVPGKEIVLRLLFSITKNSSSFFKRVFFLYGKKNKIRGDHAHKKCSQLFLPVSGKITLSVSTPNYKKKIIISANSKYGILVPPLYWCSAKFNEKNSILMVINDREYEFKDYLETFDEYKKYLLKR